MYNTNWLNKFILLSTCVGPLKSVTCSFNDRIHGGSNASQGEFPFVVYIAQNGWNVPEGWCTGGIVSEKWVLTAGHCVIAKSNVTEPPRSVQVPKEFIWIVAGDVREKCFSLLWIAPKDSIRVQGCDTLQIRRPQKVYYTLLYKDELPVFDIAALEVAKAFDLTKPNVGMIPLQSAPWPRTDPLKVSCVAVGFGLLNRYKEADVLQKAYVVVGKGKDACPCGYSDPAYRGLPLYANVLLCLQDEEMTGGICGGDSGGLLVCDGLATGIAHVTIPADCLPRKQLCGQQQTSIYQYIRPYLNWLRNRDVVFITNDASTPTQLCSFATISVIVLVLSFVYV